MSEKSILVEKDGSQWCAYRQKTFTNIQESIVGWGDTPQEAINDLIECEEKL